MVYLQPVARKDCVQHKAFCPVTQYDPEYDM